MQTKTLIISFSLRQNSESSRVGKYIQNIWGENAEFLNLVDYKIPFWNEDFWNKTPEWNLLLEAIYFKLQSADSYIFICPEYNGTPSPSYFNFMLFLSQESFHKPVMLVGVSSGRGGAYPISAMKSFGNKNTKILIIPEYIIVRDAENVLLNKPEFSKSDNFLIEKIQYSLEVLEIYAKNCRNIRNEIQPNPKFKNGM